MIEDENDNVCEFCEGTGEIEDYEWDDDSHNYIPSGMKKCICLENFEEEEYD